MKKKKTIHWIRGGRVDSTRFNFSVNAKASRASYVSEEQTPHHESVKQLRAVMIEIDGERFWTRVHGVCWQDEKVIYVEVAVAMEMLAR